MRIVDPDQRQLVVGKLKEFIDEAIKATSNHVAHICTPDDNDFLEGVLKQMHEVDASDQSVGKVFAQVNGPRQAEVLISLQALSHLKTIQTCVDRYAYGETVGDILSDESCLPHAVLGASKLSSEFPRAFSTKKMSFVKTTSENGRNFSQKQSWKDLETLLSAYNKAMRVEGDALLGVLRRPTAFVTYDAFDVVLEQIGAEQSKLKSQGFFEAPRLGVDYTLRS